VRGKDAHSFYTGAGEQVGMLNRPKWNFHKYLLGKNGEMITSFGSTISPTAPHVIDVIEAALQE